MGEKMERSVLEREVEVCTLIWALSTVLPLIYFGQKDTGKLQPDAKVQCVYMVICMVVWEEGGWCLIMVNLLILPILESTCIK